MAATAAYARTVDELVSVIRDGGQPKYLLFWGHQPEPESGVGKGCLSQWWPAAFTVDSVAYPSAEHYMMAAKARLLQVPKRYFQRQIADLGFFDPSQRFFRRSFSSIFPFLQAVPRGLGAFR